MQYTLPLKEKQIQQSRLEAEARKELLRQFGIAPGTRDAHAFTYLDFERAARAYGAMGGFAHLATLIRDRGAPPRPRHPHRLEDVPYLGRERLFHVEQGALFVRVFAGFARRDEFLDEGAVVGLD